MYVRPCSMKYDEPRDMKISTRAKRNDRTEYEKTLRKVAREH